MTTEEQAIELLREITIFSYRVDGRLTQQFENGWNSAIQHVSAKATAFLTQIGRDDPDEDYENDVDNPAPPEESS